MNQRLLFLMVLVLTLFCVSSSPGQGPLINDPLSADKSRPDKDDPLASTQREIRARLEIQRAEKERKENLERAREVAFLGTELRNSYTQNKTLAHADLKKLERLEKLTRRIRSEAGGSDDNEPLKEIPRGIEAALKRLAELSEALQKGVEKTPRQVISTAVIEHANEMLELIAVLRTLSR